MVMTWVNPIEGYLKQEASVFVPFQKRAWNGWGAD
jgi:hypothetical protein